ncbi:hypothetical protein PsAD2_03623 [Pseudovibrio axinellae]|uniref:Uncharacterized protein n=1 Tax=Pseudovibrio axinellae TaxID=989403 RepID=A0A165VS98_9HYPH|nr:hypothetical protein PsAD2_03623 [Pseudovibrio axinellae]SER53534.1 hypothetical protein SAMN05421798_11220 [Pseudovibrio axinellae]
MAAGEHSKQARRLKQGAPGVRKRVGGFYM